MRNEILKILWFSTLMCGNVFSSDYRILIENHSEEPISLSRVYATELEPRTIEIIDSLGKQSRQRIENTNIEPGKSLRLGIDARAYFKDEGENLDSIDLKMNNEVVSCVLNTKEGSGLVYPDLLSIAKEVREFKARQEHILSNGEICTLTLDNRGSNFTLTISGTPKQSPNNSGIGQQSAY